MKVCVDLKAGRLVALPSGDAEYPGIAIFLERDGRLLQLAVIEEDMGVLRLRAYPDAGDDEPSIGAAFEDLDRAMELHGYDAPKKMDAYERAKKLIDDFCQKEYGSRADFRYPNKVGVAYTTVTVAELEMQVNVNLIECSIDRFLNGVQLKSRKYQTLSELIRCELEWLDFSDLVDIDDEDIAFYLQYKDGVYCIG